MATPLPHSKIVSILRTEGVVFTELPGWRNHKRSGAFSPEAFMLHYTAGNYSSARGYAGPGGILWDGRAGVPGPLCHFGIDKNGHVWLIGGGRANHSGRVNGTAIRRATSGRMPMTGGTQRPSAGDTVDGNALTYGIEMMTATTPTDAQLEASIKVMAAVLRAHGWDAGHVIGHGEATRRKTGDPRNVDMGDVRRRVAARLKGNTSGGFTPVTPKPEAKPEVKPVQEDEVPRVIEKTFEFQHGGAGYQVQLDSSYFKATKPIKAMNVRAVVHGPEGNRLATRWVAWVHDTDKRKGFWDRRAETVHTSNHAETDHIGFTVDDKVDLYLDVFSNKPGKHWVQISGLIWD